MGHLGRCLTLAHSLRAKGATVSFVCRAHPDDLSGVIETMGFGVRRLPFARAVVESDGPRHAAWLGAPWEQDCRETAECLAAETPDWLIVDHYGVDFRWEHQLRRSATSLMVIDDLADRRHECDLLLDQNLVADAAARYRGKVPEGCGMLLGPHYALLDSRYGELHGRVVPRTRPVRRILVSFGVADHHHLAARTLAAFASLGRTDIEVDAVIPGPEAHAFALRTAAASLPGVRIQPTVPSLAPLMASADLAVGAAGVTSWERLCLGLPALVITLAANQRPNAEHLGQLDLIRWLGDAKDVSDELLAAELQEAIHAGVDRERVQRSLRLVDGKGVARVCALLTVTGSTPVEVRPASADDEGLLLEWANDPDTRRNAFSSAPIPDTTHAKWFRERLQRVENCRIYIVETADGTPLGQVRFDLREKNWEVDYGVAPLFRRRGLGRPVLRAAMSRLRAELPEARIRGVVKPNNQASQQVFRGLGFEVVAPNPDGAIVFERTLRVVGKDE